MEHVTFSSFASKSKDQVHVWVAELRVRGPEESQKVLPPHFEQRGQAIRQEKREPIQQYHAVPDLKIEDQPHRKHPEDQS